MRNQIFRRILETSKAKILSWLVFLTGLFFMGLGISLVTKSGLGTSPISSVPYVLSMILPITIGQFTFLLSLLFLLIEILILRRDFPKEQYFQVLVGPFFGLFVDLGMTICAFVNPHYYAEKILILLFGCVVLALGVYLQVAANVIVNPGEGVVKVIAAKTGAKFGNIKILFDSSLCSIAILISLYAFGTVKGVREGTIVSAILVGFNIKIISALFNRFHKKRMAAIQ